MIQRLFIFLCCFVCYWGLPMALAAQQSVAIGRILQTKGHVQARDSNGVLRDVNRRSALFAGDRLITGPGGLVQIRMIDSAMISLQEDTEFTFHEYYLGNDPATPDKAIMELHQGGFRTISGLIGSDDQDEYRLITPDTDVKPDGTTYQCVIDNGKTICGVFDGGISMTNPTDSIRLGLGSNWDYAEVESRQHQYVPLLSKPPALPIDVNQSTVDFVGSSSATNPSGHSGLPAGSNTTLAPAPQAPAGAAAGFPEPPPIPVKPYKKP